jgi:taurine dioxygenase
MLTIEPLTPTIGAELHGFDFRESHTDSAMKELQQALLTWKVIFFRDQDIGLEDQKRAGLWFGPLEVHPLVAPDQPNAELIRIEEDDVKRAHNDIWHSDVTFKESPPLGSILRAREIPPVGGDTMFADMYAAYEGLDEQTKSRVDNATAVHDFHGFRRGMRARGVPEAEIDKYKLKFPPREHPVVRTHPQTGRRSLFVNAAFTTHIVGLPKTESDALLAVLYSQARIPEYQCRFRWRKDSIAFWDNRCTQHYAVADFYPQRRVVERITICGDKPR